MKLRWSVKRGGIIVKRIQRALAHNKIAKNIQKTHHKLRLKHYTEKLLRSLVV